MGKQKQQKLYKLSHRKPSSQMGTIMDKLAQNKQHTSDIHVQLTSITQFHSQKPIRKLPRQKYPQKQAQVQPQTVIQKPIVQPTVNIFAIDSFDSGKKTELQVPSKTVLVDQTLLLEMQATKLMPINLQKFGDKPLRVIDQPDVIEEEEVTILPHPGLKRPLGSQRVSRKTEIQKFRQLLPIYMREQEIIETIGQHLVTLVCGETGSGKSTQLPQFLVENNYHLHGNIAITQPRRLATVSLASRVSEEMNVGLGVEVGYQVRHDRRDSQATVVKFMTDGILLNELGSDNLLSAYSVVIIDEAHERKVNTDILIGLLSRLILLRYEASLHSDKIHPLRLVIMSATMRVEDFKNSRLFDYYVPVINVEARMFPVTVYHEKHTPEDYKLAAVNKCVNIHRRLPDGDVLIFMTGKEEIKEVASLLHQALSNSSYQPEDEVEGEIHSDRPFIILSLYSSLPMEEQRKVFQPSTSRKFIISTNIAQTSITIPNIRYVVDSGQQKHRYFEGIWKWSKGWGSQAMAEQRAGRAGRTAEGSCYRLYSAALFANIMQKYAQPEISKQPLASVILQLKCMGIPSMYLFPFPTAPQNQKIRISLEELVKIGALEGTYAAGSDQTKVTQLGSVLSMIPLEPKLAKLLLMGRQLKVERHCLLLVILLTVESIFLEEGAKDVEEMRVKARLFRSRYAPYTQSGSDIFTCLNILGEFFKRLYTSPKGVLDTIRDQSNSLELNASTMREVYFNADQICQIFETLCSEKISLNNYTRPSEGQSELILDILLHIFVENLCRSEDRKYLTRNNEPVHLHYQSSLYSPTSNNLFLCCTEFYKTTTQRMYMRYPFVVRNYELLVQYGSLGECKQYTVRDRVVVGVAIGTIYGWEIPKIVVETAENYFYAAKALLEGSLVQQFKALQKYYMAPLGIIKQENLDYKVQKLVETLKVHKVKSETAATQRFRRDKLFLKEELKPWLNVHNYEEVYQKLRISIISK